jgi:hypothetical protein
VHDRTEVVVVIRRAAPLLVRAAVLCGFTWYVWNVHYLPHRGTPFGDSDTAAAMAAINAGHPFQLLYESGANQPPTVRPISALYADYGVPIAAAFVAKAGRWWRGPSFRIEASVGWTILMGLFVVTAAAIVGPGVPLVVAAAGVAALWVLLAWGPMNVGPAQHWGVAYVTVVIAVFIGTVFGPWTTARACSLVLLGALASWAQLLRQEGSIVPTAAALGLLLSAALINVVHRRSSASGLDDLQSVASRAAIAGTLLLIANSLVLPLERLMFSRAWGTSYTETSAAAHGSGWPLYLSLGYVENPYNIGWRDPIGQVHALLIAPGVRYGDVAFQPTLFREYLRIVATRPWLLLDNIRAKAARVHALATRRAEPLPDVAVWQRPVLSGLYRALPWVGVACAALLWWRGTPQMVAVAVSSSALAAAAVAGALVVFPDYIGGVQGGTVALALIVPAALIASVRRSPSAMPGTTLDTTPAARRILAVAAALAIGCVLVAGAYVGIQWMRYRALQDRVAAGDPLEGIVAEEFRYAHVFNDLPVATQGRLVARLTASCDPRVARRVDERHGDLGLFRPEALIRTATQLHLIAWMGTSFHAPVPPLYQGTTHALFFICGECPADATVNDFPFDAGWTFINDLEWRGRYRMFSVALNPRLREARAFQVGAEKVVALDFSIASTGLRPSTMAGARVSF